MSHQKLNYKSTTRWSIYDPAKPPAGAPAAADGGAAPAAAAVGGAAPADGGAAPAAAGAAPANGYGSGLGLTFNKPPPATNPLKTTGTINNCCPNPVVTAWLTDDDGDMTFSPVAIMITPPPNPQTQWNTTFPTMPPGNYTLTVQVQCNGNTVNQSINITL